MHKRCAPTAKAAFLIKGSTIHSIFSIPVNKKEKDDFPNLTGEQLNNLQNTFAGCEYIIIDEYSMLSQVMCAQIDKRLRQATGKMNSYFGGISIILVGDPGQLLPVGGSPLYQFPTKSALSLHGLNCYKQFENAIALQVSQRQTNETNDPDQEYFIQLLKRLREGMIDDEKTLEDWKFLLKNKVTPNKLLEFENAIRLFSDNASCHDYNASKLKELKQPITKLVAKNSSSRVRSANDDNFSSLKNFFFLCINARITLTNNIWTKHGLVNGANGTIRDILYDAGSSLPYAILIEFDNYSGPKFFDNNDDRHNWIPIYPLTIYNPNFSGSRTQYPIRLAYALTIHKSQGQTLDKVVIDLGKNERSLGLAFVALSRVKKFNDFLIQPITLDRLTKIKNSTSLVPRVKEEKRISSIVEKTFNKYNELMPK
jgi:ATP-dependent DNA helicase PIF1